MAHLSIADLNEQNHRFWQAESDLFNRRMSDELLFEVATTDMRSETLRRVPINSQKTMEQALADAEKTRHGFQSALARKGGKAPKPNALQNLIEEIVLKEPTITERQLYFALKAELGSGTITSIDKESDVLADEPRMIHFVEDNGKPMTAPLSVLKDRLFRAKKKINSRQPS
jgi:hypothetical protein